MKIRWLCPAIFAVTMLAGCGSNSPLAEDLKRYTTSPEDHAAQSPEPFAEARRVRIRALDNTPYVSLQDVMSTTGLRGARLQDGSYGVGDHDPIWSFQAGERKATVDGKQRELAAPALEERDELYIPLSALQSLFGDVAIFKVESRHVEFYPRTTDKHIDAHRESADFSDAVSAKSTATVNMIAYAKNFLGVNYDFGAGSYAQSGKFDCSSYVQHVFGHFGIDMPRTAREQAQGGTPVSSSSLIPGDLLFFNVPGTFKNRQAVGHVGIYMGEGNMIHASPAGDNGVQITPVNSRYWQNNFLHARRYVQ
ncbi:C40 family peptidase [Cohnella kolymensis]|uniref:C40 family peptidase n=1 Tax=Cohnella kolymensis TaxID=1590652 RepID=UPI000696EEF0|nr:C40 family peptidase [Cohnella kolymensis]